MYIAIITQKRQSYQQLLMSASLYGRTSAYAFGIVFSSLLWDFTKVYGFFSYFIFLQTVSILCMLKLRRAALIALHNTQFTRIDSIHVDMNDDGNKPKQEREKQESVVDGVQINVFKQKVVSQSLAVVIIGGGLCMFCFKGIVIGCTVVLSEFKSATIVAIVYALSTTLAVILSNFGLWKKIVFPIDVCFLLTVLMLACIGFTIPSFTNPDLFLLFAGIAMYATNSLIIVIGKNLLKLAPPIGLASVLGVFNIVKTSSAAVSSALIPYLLYLKREYPFIIVESMCFACLAFIVFVYMYVQNIYLFCFCLSLFHMLILTTYIA